MPSNIMQFIGLIVFCLLPALSVTAQSERRATTTFIDVTTQAGIRATHRGVWDPDVTAKGYLAIGLAWGDYNNDSWDDLYVTGNRDPNALYMNNGDGTFSLSQFANQVRLPSADSGGVVWVDYDNDGWKDLYVVNRTTNSLFHNEEGNGFRDVTREAGVGDTGKGTSSAWGDYDNDGLLDLYVTNWSCFPECHPVDFSTHRDRLYHNNGDGMFADVTKDLSFEKTLGSGFAVSFVDYDNDHDLDIYVINDKLQNEIGNVLWRNDGAGCTGWCWADVSVESGLDLVINGMGLDAGDYDNDGDFDFYVTDLVYNMYLMTNQGDGTFVDHSVAAGVDINHQPDNGVGWGTAFFDYDNDGWQDLFVATTGYRQPFPDLLVSFMNPYRNALFHNAGDGTFTDVTAASGLDAPYATMGVAYADYDGDGDVDLAVGNWNDGYRLYRNNTAATSENHWLQVQLIGNHPINRDAVGSRVILRTDDGMTQMQAVTLGSGLGSANSTDLHFGLGQANIEQIMVIWPDGTSCDLYNVEHNQRLTLTYNSSGDCVT